MAHTVVAACSATSEEPMAFPIRGLDPTVTTESFAGAVELATDLGDEEVAVSTRDVEH